MLWNKSMKAVTYKLQPLQEYKAESTTLKWFTSEQKGAVMKYLESNKQSLQRWHKKPKLAATLQTIFLPSVATSGHASTSWQISSAGVATRVAAERAWNEDTAHSRMWHRPWQVSCQKGMRWMLADESFAQLRRTLSLLRHSASPLSCLCFSPIRFHSSKCPESGRNLSQLLNASISSALTRRPLVFTPSLGSISSSLVSPVFSVTRSCTLSTESSVFSFALLPVPCDLSIA